MDGYSLIGAGFSLPVVESTGKRWRQAKLPREVAFGIRPERVVVAHKPAGRGTGQGGGALGGASRQPFNSVATNGRATRRWCQPITHLASTASFGLGYGLSFIIYWIATLEFRFNPRPDKGKYGGETHGQ